MANGASSTIPILGTVLGGGLGGAIGGPAGAKVGAQIGTGAGQLISGLISGGKGQQAGPPSEDPELRRFLNEIDRRRKTFETGAAFQVGKRELRQQQAATQQGILRASGGASGAAISGLARSQRGTQTAFNELIGRGEARQDQMTQLFGNVLNRIAQRRLELSLAEQAKQEARQASSQRQGTANILQGVARGLPVQGAQGAPQAPTQAITSGIPLAQQIQQQATPETPQIGDLLSQIIGAQGGRQQLAQLLGLNR